MDVGSIAAPSAVVCTCGLSLAAWLLVRWRQVEAPSEGRFELAVVTLPVGCREERDQFSQEVFLTLTPSTGPRMGVCWIAVAAGRHARGCRLPINSSHVAKD